VRSILVAPGPDGAPWTFERVFAACAETPDLVAFDSSGGEPARWSLVGLRGEALDGAPTDLLGLRQSLERAGVLPATGRPHGWPPELADAPFCGGFAGALAYEIGVAGDPIDLPPEPYGFPLLTGSVLRDFALLDHVGKRLWLILDEAGDPPVEVREAQFRTRLARTHVLAAPRTAGPLVRHTPAFVHRARVESLRRAVRTGDVYQANLAHRFTRAVRGHPVALHLLLRRHFPAPYAGYLALGARGAKGALSSHSPELLLRVDGQGIHTRPIKGTAPRALDPTEDAQQARGLLANPKERAELAMIVDLARNDLGRVSTPGSVRVEPFGAIESYAGVHHLVAEVHGELEPTKDALDALAAVFPGASITGAPKLAAMECIAALEREGRGFFTGSLGFLSNDGSAAFNVLIRSPLWRALPGEGEQTPRGELSLRVGGGITFGSDPRAEDEETLHKARAFLNALDGVERE